MPSLTLPSGHKVLFSEEDAPLVRRLKWYTCQLFGHVYARSGPSKRPADNKKMMHRLILKPAPGLNVDHVNGDGLDNRRENIRVCTQSQNLANRKQTPCRKAGAALYKGVTQRGTGWAAEGVHAKQRYRLGVYETPEDAAYAYDNWTRATNGEFARPNFPDKFEAPARRPPHKTTKPKLRRWEKAQRAKTDGGR